MLNQYPTWKNVLIILIAIISLVYALPNLYPEDYAVQISHDGGEMPPQSRQLLETALSNANIASKKIEQNDAGQLMVRLSSANDQLKTKQLAEDTLDDEHVAALNLVPAIPGWLSAIHAFPMNLGLDLRGGVHFLLQVDMAEAVKKALNRYEGEFRDTLRELDIRGARISVEHNEVVARFREASDRERGAEEFEDRFGDELQFEQSEDDKYAILSAHLKEDAVQNLQELALQQNITTLRKRVNSIGVAEPVIQQQGVDRIVVQLPGVQDSTVARTILGATATLEFRLVDTQGDAFLAVETGRVPLGTQLFYRSNGDPILLNRRVMLTGDYIVNANPTIDPDTNGPAVSVVLDGAGAKQFSKVTGDNIGRPMATVFIETKTELVMRDGEMVPKTVKSEEVINVATIRDQLSKLFQITGLDNTQEATKLALLLRAGALAAPMSIVEERTIGPSLGQQNIDQGKLSVMVGFILVLIFMAIYYRVFGLIANVALAFNVVLMIAVLSMLPGATLTLPGIAGIVLTVGMAVDANVLIFERIREELRNGNSPQASIHAGYSKALSTIADANITTLIAAIVLFTFGTGPIKGFAVTLMIGIPCSMFTAIMGTRAIVNVFYGRKRLTSLTV